MYQSLHHCFGLPKCLVPWSRLISALGLTARYWTLHTGTKQFVAFSCCCTPTFLAVRILSSHIICWDRQWNPKQSLTSIKPRCSIEEFYPESVYTAEWMDKDTTYTMFCTVRRKILLWINSFQHFLKRFTKYSRYFLQRMQIFYGWHPSFSYSSDQMSVIPTFSALYVYFSVACFLVLQTVQENGCNTNFSHWTDVCIHFLSPLCMPDGLCFLCCICL